MGEQKEEVKNEVEKKPAAAGDGAPKDAGNAAPAVFKMDMHCEGCAKKIKRTISNIEGVEAVKTDRESNKITVTGNVDPTKVKERLEGRTKKNVEILSPQPKKDGGDKKPEDKEKSEKKPAEEKKPEETKPKEITVVLKIRLHCDGCIHKIKKIIRKCEGVSAVSADADKDQVTVTGTMDVKEMVPYLKARLKRNVEVAPPPAKKDGGGDGGDKKEKEKPKEAAPAAAADGGEKKEGGGGEKKEGKKEEAPKDAKKDEGNAPKVEVNKMEYHGHQLAPLSYFHDVSGQNFTMQQPFQYHGGHPNQGYAMQPYQYHGGYPNQGYATSYAGDGYANDGYGYGYGYASTGTMVDPRLHMNPRLHAPQMFSDENPNACSIM